MNFLLLSPKIPKSDGKGYQVLLYWRIQTLLSAGHTVDLQVISYSGREGAEDAELQKLVDSGLAINFHKVSKLRITINIFTAILKRKPLQNALYFDPNIRRILISQDERKRFAVCICYMIRLHDLAVGLGKRYVLEAVDSMALNFKRRYINEKNLLKKILWYFEFKFCTRFEESISGCDLVLTVSDLDAAFFKHVDARALPLGVTEVDDRQTDLVGTPSIIFSGDLRYEPNIKALEWWFGACWTLVKRKFPGAMFYVVGRGSDDLRVPINDKQVKLLGEVASITHFLAAADVSVAPMVSGSGMQFKILEAMASGTPVITTSVGLGAIRAKVGHDVLVADDANEFVAGLKLLQEDAAIALNGKRFVETHHSWEAIGELFLSCVLVSDC